MTTYLTLAQVMEVADLVVPGVGVREPGLLASAVARPQISVFGDDAYPSLSDKAAALMHSLARDRCLVDGNKRLAWVCTVAFYRLNGRDLVFDDVDEAEQLVLGVAQGNLSADALSSELDVHTVLLDP